MRFTSPWQAFGNLCQTLNWNKFTKCGKFPKIKFYIQIFQSEIAFKINFRKKVIKTNKITEGGCTKLNLGKKRLHTYVDYGRTRQISVSGLQLTLTFSSKLDIKRLNYLEFFKLKLCTQKWNMKISTKEFFIYFPKSVFSLNHLSIIWT